MKKSILVIVTFLLFLSCTQDRNKLFQKVEADESGIYFSNDLAINDTLNAAVFEYIYNGAGVAVADFNQDGLQDLFFTGNQVSSKLYLNKGDFHFDDITESAGVTTSAWCTGVTIVDINQDGLPDIYVSVAGYKVSSMENLLFVNQGDLTFREEAKIYGLNDNSYGTQAAFFDYDLDGDLDMYQLNNALEEYNRGKLKAKVLDGTARSTDNLYQNNEGKFTDVSDQSGILKEGWGLGLNITDINQDGWPDIYVSNDFQSNDLMYINQGDGTFRDEINSYLNHQSLNGMGNDVADYNNDGYVDIVVLDMLPEDNYRQKMMLLPASYNQFTISLNYGYQPQYVRNTLQLNNGNGSFSEIGQLAGIESTDWSWGSLFADFDNDGWKDLFVTNGYRQDVTNLDYISYTQKVAAFGTDEAKKRNIIDEMQNLEGVELHNYIFRNEGDLTFSDQSLYWGIEEETFSNGAVYADLDNDGDLDLVINNIDQIASVYKNFSMEQNAAKKYLTVSLYGKEGNIEAIGARVEVRTSQGNQFMEKSPVRGYKSSVDPRLFFGIPGEAEIEQVKVFWPDGTIQTIADPGHNQILRVTYSPQSQVTRVAHSSDAKTPFMKKQDSPLYIHRENDYADFNGQVLMPHKYSQDGPCAAVGDINGDGLDDLFLGGSAGYPGQILIQLNDGTFKVNELTGSENYHDADAVLFDADNDGDADLLVASGGNQFVPGSEEYRNRLYYNNGDGKFTLKPHLFTETENSRVLAVSDMDQDGDMDVFVGGSILPGQYPVATESYLLRNESGQFMRESLNLKNNRVVNDALWTDIDRDGWEDLLLATEWGPVVVLKNREGKLTDNSEQAGLNQFTGWWQRLYSGDFDGDGDLDIIAGNMGDNHQYDVSQETPLRIYLGDFDENGTPDPVMSYYNLGSEVIIHPRDQMINQIPAIKKRFPKYEEYARAVLSETFLDQEIEKARVYEAINFSTVYLENTGGGSFAVRELPRHIQFAPLQGGQVLDVNEDGNLDFVFVGNDYSAEVQYGRYDASVGGVLIGDGQGSFKYLPGNASGFAVKGDAQELLRLQGVGKEDIFIATRNRDSLVVFEMKPPAVDLNHEKNL